uniref:Uncharacterized protein n=1 Tax=Anguilla anguilla TaxID=7936 RepID=A0A0E9TTE4_ANGAN
MLIFNMCSKNLCSQAVKYGKR